MINNENALHPPSASVGGFFFVAESDEISNLDLISDIYCINRLIEIL
jgi:hypothetical protein